MDENVKIVTAAVLDWCEWDIGRMYLNNETEKEAKVAEMVRCLMWTLVQDPAARAAFMTNLYELEANNRRAHV